ncbi:MAG: helix-turn-helix transcriptional regulator [Smithellaceae bacterium]|nr:helix-turn-helix transcriptional regulator [Smithellaceae bacterium]
MSGELMGTKELARYLDIHEKQVYALIKAGRLPATKITGKWIFPKKMVDAWIERHAGQGIKEARRKSSHIEGAVLAAGSNDPILDVLLTVMKKSHPDYYFFSAVTGSTDGLKALNGGYTDVAWCHLLDPENGSYNTPAILAKLLPEVRPVVVHLFRRQLGLIVASGNPWRVGGIADLAGGRLRLVNRQEGSGTRILLDQRLAQSGLRKEEISGYEREVYTHFEVGLAVLSGEADVGIGSVYVAKMLGLSFVPLTEESFDMILSRDTFFSEGIQAFLEVLKSSGMRSQLAGLANYGFADTGKILYAQS